MRRVVMKVTDHLMFFCRILLFVFNVTTLFALLFCMETALELSCSLHGLEVDELVKAFQVIIQI